MEKRCARCKEIKDISKFVKYRKGVNKGHWQSWCRKCHTVYAMTPQRVLSRKRYYATFMPWKKTFVSIVGRCTSRNNRYYKKGIKNFLSVSDLKYLWFRDKAYLMKCPSIDRINNNGNYTIENCKYMELIDNCRKDQIGRKFSQEWKDNISKATKERYKKFGHHMQREIK